jgi:hypothetical protein
MGTLGLMRYSYLDVLVPAAHGLEGALVVEVEEQEEAVRLLQVPQRERSQAREPTVVPCLQSPCWLTVDVRPF